jgi:putative transcriptional regulator
MSKAAFDKIAEGLTEAREIARGNAAPLRLYVPPEIDVRDIRSKAALTQDGFASAFGFTVHQIRQWEQGRARPLGALRAYLMLIGRNPKTVLAELHAAMPKRPARKTQRRPAAKRTARERAFA